jgi:hypothetical protein
LTLTIGRRQAFVDWVSRQAWHVIESGPRWPFSRRRLTQSGLVGVVAAGG